MKYCLFVLLVVCLVATLTMSANALIWRWDFDGNTALTSWNHQSNSGDPLLNPNGPGFASPALPGAIQANAGFLWGRDSLEMDDNIMEMSEGVASSGSNGAVRIVDNEPATGGYQSFHSRYEVGENNGNPPATSLKRGAMAIFRAKVLTTIDGYGIGVGYSTVDGNHTGILGLGNGTVNLVGWDNAVGPIAYNLPGGGKSVSVGVNSGWKTYAFKQSYRPADGGTWYEVWVSNGTSWSANASDWTQVLAFHPDRSAPGNNAITDTSADSWDLGRAEGVMIGSFGPSAWHAGGRTASGQIDIDSLMFINHQANTDNWNINPWDVPLIPEPGSILALGSGLIGMAGFAIRRRRA